MQMPPKADGPRVATFDARAIFNRLDKNQDGKLSFEEFAAGLRRIASDLLAMRAPTWQMPRPGQWFGTARDKMFAYGAEFAKSCFAGGPQHRHCCPYCGAAMKGPQHRGPDGLGQGLPGRSPVDRPPPSASWRHGLGKYAHQHHHGDMGWGEHCSRHHGDMNGPSTVPASWRHGMGEYGHHHHGDMGSGEYGHHGIMATWMGRVWSPASWRHGLGRWPHALCRPGMADGYPPPEWFRGPRYDGTPTSAFDGARPKLPKAGSGSRAESVLKASGPR